MWLLVAVGGPDAMPPAQRVNICLTSYYTESYGLKYAQGQLRGRHILVTPPQGLRERAAAGAGRNVIKSCVFWPKPMPAVPGGTEKIWRREGETG